MMVHYTLTCIVLGFSPVTSCILNILGVRKFYTYFCINYVIFLKRYMYMYMYMIPGDLHKSKTYMYMYMYMYLHVCILVIYLLFRGI